MAPRKDTLTGGTGDVNPQIQTLNCTPAANAWGQCFFNTTVNGTVNGGSSSCNQMTRVLEVLKVQFDLPVDNVATLGIKSAVAQLSTRSFAGYSNADPHVFCFAQFDANIFQTAPPEAFAHVSQRPIVLDLTDGDGHGILVATPTIYFGVQNFGYSGAYTPTYVAKIFYRFKNVNLIEYVGMVQSQQ